MNQGAVDVAWFQRDLFRRAFGLHNKAFFRAVYIETMALFSFISVDRGLSLDTVIQLSVGIPEVYAGYSDVLILQ